MAPGELLPSVVTLAVGLVLAGCSLTPSGSVSSLTTPSQGQSECRALIDSGRLPPRSDEECAQWDAGARERYGKYAAENAADLTFINGYFAGHPTVLRPQSCDPPDPSFQGAFKDCRSIVKTMIRVDRYREAHPNRPLPEDCSLPLRPGFLGVCEVEIEAAEAPPRPAPEWHRLIKDTIGCYRGGIYADGNYVGAANGCIEIPAGRVFLLQPTTNIGEEGRTTYSPPLALRIAVAPMGLSSSLTMRSDAFDPTVLHCHATQVLLHREVTCEGE